MRIAMAQMKMNLSVQDNLNKSIEYIREAKKRRADFIFFPEVQA